ncbi:MFS transporter [Nakamurella silvestris]|nr:MFS transporter [Nakamurella silvestris]
MSILTPSRTSTADPVRHRRNVLITCLSAGFITLLDTSMVVAAVPAIRAELGASTGQMQWVVAAYSLSFALALVPAGRFGDLLGRHRLFTLGLLVFGTCSVLGGLAVAPWMVIVGRLLQGFGAGTLNPQVHGLIQDMFQGRDRARAIGWYATVGGVAATLGPLLGGGILAVFPAGVGWRVLLVANLPLGLYLYRRARKLFPRTATPPSTTRSTTRSGTRTGTRPGRGLGAGLRQFDVVGLGLLAAALMATLIPITADSKGFPLLLGLGLSLWTVLALIGWERSLVFRGRKPLIPPGLAALRGYPLGTVIALLIFGASLSLSLVLSSYLQESIGLSAWQAGLVILPSAVASALTSSISGNLVSRWGRNLVSWSLFGAVLAVACMYLGTHAPAAQVPWWMSGANLLFGAAIGLGIGPNQMLTLVTLPTGRVGLGAGVYQLTQRLSATVVMPLCWGIYERIRVSGVPQTPASGGLAARTAVAVILGILVLALAVALLSAYRERGSRVPSPA